MTQMARLWLCLPPRPSLRLSRWQSRCCHAQSPPAPLPAFEVVSIKANPVLEGTLHKMYSRKPAIYATGNRFAEKQTTLQDLVMEAYGMWGYQISGLPDWAQAPNGEHYAVDATVPGDQAPAADQLRLMVQSLLADRFHLRVHREMKELPVYCVLAVGKNGSRLTELPGRSASWRDDSGFYQSAL